MNIIITTVQTPFLLGGADFHAQNLKTNLIKHGHSVEIVTTPFVFSPLEKVMEYLNFWKKQDFKEFSGITIDLVIALKFPTYHIPHPSKTIWLMHQHRAIYELANSPYGEKIRTTKKKKLREEIISLDKEALNKKDIYTNSKTVSKRLMHYLKTKSEPLYHPPPFENNFKSGPIYPYIFYPSRLFEIKRQDLLVKAMKYTKSPVISVISGDGPILHNLKKLASKLDVESKVIFTGPIDHHTKFRYYSNSLGVFFGALNEDYGYVTLEAMLSSKPVITCHDSGGPLEFINNDFNGFVVDPDPIQIADSIDRLWDNKKLAISMGQNGRTLYNESNISWDNVVNKLLGKKL